MGSTMRIRKDDQVMIIGGKDAGKTGRVTRTEPKRGRVYVENLNIIKRHNARARSKTPSAAARSAGSSKRRGRSTSPT